MEDKINIAREKLEITFPLKEKQMETAARVRGERLHKWTINVFVT